MHTSKLLFLLSTVLVIACSGNKKMYQSEILKGKDYSVYKTYAWTPTLDTSYTKLVNKQHLENELALKVTEQLTKKGLTFNKENPDCLFRYQLVMNRKYDVSQETGTAYNAEVYVSPYNTNNMVYFFSSDNKAYSYSGELEIGMLRSGTLVIDMIDHKDGKVIWRTSATAERDEANLPGIYKTLEIIIPEMFKKFPRK